MSSHEEEPVCLDVSLFEQSANLHGHLGRTTGYPRRRRMCLAEKGVPNSLVMGMNDRHDGRTRLVDGSVCQRLGARPDRPAAMDGVAFDRVAGNAGEMRRGSHRMHACGAPRDDEAAVRAHAYVAVACAVRIGADQSRPIQPVPPMDELPDPRGRFVPGPTQTELDVTLGRSEIAVASRPSGTPSLAVVRSARD